MADGSKKRRRRKRKKSGNPIENLLAFAYWLTLTKRKRETKEKEQKYENLNVNDVCVWKGTKFLTPHSVPGMFGISVKEIILIQSCTHDMPFKNDLSHI